MKLRKLARLCEHDQLAPHEIRTAGLRKLLESCPGGVFLPDDTIIIEKNVRAIEKVANEIAEWESAPYEGPNTDSYETLALLILDALSVREAE